MPPDPPTFCVLCTLSSGPPYILYSDPALISGSRYTISCDPTISIIGMVQYDTISMYSPTITRGGLVGTAYFMLQVTSYELQVTSYKLRVISYVSYTPISGA